MTNSKFFHWQLKEWFPLFGLVLLPLLRIVPQCFQMPFTNTITAETLTLIVFLFSFLEASILPLMIFTYRWSKKSADTFLQLPCNEGEIKKTRTLILLLIVLSHYLLLTIITDIAIIVSSFSEKSAVYQSINVGYLFLSNFIFLVMTFAQFSVTYFFCYRGNTLIQSIVYLVVGSLLLSSIISGTLGYIAIFSGNHIVPASIGTTSSYTYFSPAVLYYSITVMIYKIDGVNWGNPQLISLFYFILTIIVGLAASIYTYLSKEPSGDTAGLQEPRSTFDKILIHATYFFSAGVFLSQSAEKVIHVISLAFVAALYYTLLVFVHHTIHFSKRTYITFASLVLFSMVIAFTR